MHYSAILPLLIQEVGQIEGRKKIQKIVHILQSAGAPFRERFDYALFGPFSGTLKAELDHLAAFDILSEEPRGMTYLFSPGERFEEVRKAGLLNERPPWADVAKKLNSRAPRELEALSTILYLLERGYTGAVLKSRFEQLKPQLMEYFEGAQRDALAIRSQRGDWNALSGALAA